MTFQIDLNDDGSMTIKTPEGTVLAVLFKPGWDPTRFYLGNGILLEKIGFLEKK